MLRNEMPQQGQWLFRWRSYLPLILFVLLAPAVRTFTYINNCHHCDWLWELLCLFIGTLGLIIRCLVVGYTPANTSGRNTKKQIAAALNTTGMYAMVRNPLYLGNFLMWLAPVLFLHHWLATLLYSAVFFLYYERIIFTEEEFLAKKFGDAYQNWSAKTPLLFPLRWRWVKPELPFSWKTVLRREYHGLLELIVSMTAVEFITDFIVQQRVVFDLFWIVLCTAGVVFYLTIRAAAKWTTLLIVEGRS